VKVIYAGVEVSERVWSYLIFNFRKCDKLSMFNKYAICYQHTMHHLVKEYGVMNDRIII